MGPHHPQKSGYRSRCRLLAPNGQIERCIEDQWIRGNRYPRHHPLNHDRNARSSRHHSLLSRLSRHSLRKDRNHHHQKPSMFQNLRPNHRPTGRTPSRFLRHRYGLHRCRHKERPLTSLAVHLLQFRRRQHYYLCPQKNRRHHLRMRSSFLVHKENRYPVHHKNSLSHIRLSYHHHFPQKPWNYDRLRRSRRHVHHMQLPDQMPKYYHRQSQRNQSNYLIELLSQHQTHHRRPLNPGHAGCPRADPRI